MTVGLAMGRVESRPDPHLGAAPRPGLCRGVQVSRMAGGWCRLTWRGLGEVSAALAPGRLAAALHQPPARARRFGWCRAPLRQGLPTLDERLAEALSGPADLDGVIDRLAAQPLAAPALVVLADAGLDGAVLDWSDGFLVIHRAPVCLGMPGRAAALGRSPVAAAAGGIAWLHVAIPGAIPGARRQRLAVSVNAGTGLVTVQTLDHDRPHTSTLHLPA